MNEEGQGPYRMVFDILALDRNLKCKSSCIINFINIAVRRNFTIK